MFATVPNPIPARMKGLNRAEICDVNFQEFVRGWNGQAQPKPTPSDAILDGSALDARGFDGDRGAQCLRQVGGDRRGLRQHPQRLAAPDLVAAAAGRVFRAGGEAQRRIHDRIHARQLAEALGHETAAAVMQECGVGMPRGARDHRIALVARGANRVEDLVLHPQHARHQVEVAADELRFEQFAEALRVQRTAIQDRLVRRGARILRAIPRLDELGEVDVADLGAVDAFHAGENGIVCHCYSVGQAYAPDGVEHVPANAGVGGVAPTYVINR